MAEELSLLARIVCKKLGWHWPLFSEHWHHNGQTHSVCRLCRKVISTSDGYNGWK